MVTKGTRLYVSVICGLAAVAAVLARPWEAVGALDTYHQWGLLGLICVGLLSESLILRTSSKAGEGTFTITLVPLLASVLIFGPGPTVIFMGLSGVFAEFFYHKKPLVKASFNVGQYVLASTLAGWVFSALGGRTLIASELSVGWMLLSTFPAFIAFGVTFLAVNHLSVGGVITLSRGTPLKPVLSALFGKWGSNIAYDLMVSPVAIAVAILYKDLHFFGFVTVLLPLLFIRHSYQLNYRLMKANQDLLNALVKAIETRDPYTSGHSMRVARLASLIASALGLKASRIELIEQAALLHDVGKIDAVYTEILRKPDGLSTSERSVIESHVIKGAELLETLSSVPREVIRDVRHHHERVDGQGYPDGLTGTQIPLGARIIKVCDAIDAMLSDRPYRKALDLPTTRRELRKFAGIQFDEEVVEAVIGANLLELHYGETFAARPGNAPSDKMAAEEKPVDPGSSSPRVRKPALTHRRESASENDAVSGIAPA